MTDSSPSPSPSTSSNVDNSTEPTSISTQSLSTVKENTAGVRKPPPKTKWPYDATNALDDIPGVAFALDEFLQSRMVESEDYCHEMDPKKERLYFATGYGLIQCVKAMMSYEDEDLLVAIGHTKHGNTVAQQHRKKAASLPWRLAGYTSSGVSWIKSMTDVERHAELVYAESLFEKALLGIVYSGDWLAFIKEALNMRTTISTYRQLGKYLDHMDAEAVSSGSGPIDTSIDVHFRSGVYLGLGILNIVLSLMPSRLMAIVELFGYKGDRHEGLEMLMKVGGWGKEDVRKDADGKERPGVSREEEGVRRSICDMALVIFHLVLSSFTFDGVDVMMAQKILDWNVERYPNGVFFLFGQGRLSLVRSQPKRAIEYYQKAMSAQNQYRNLHHISFWEMAVANLALWELSESLVCWRSLHKESTWSKACYAYGTAAILLQLGGDEYREEALKLVGQVPSLRQRIAGKSIPLEKFMARKARKCQSQNGRLALPALELAYLFLGIAHAPKPVILEKMLPLVDVQLAELRMHAKDTKKYGAGNGSGNGAGKAGVGYWDDWCLTRFLEGICMRYVAYPDPDALTEGNQDDVGPSKEDATARSMAAFESVFENGTNIELDHHLVYFSHYEYGRLLACKGDAEGAKHQFELVLSGKHLEVNSAGKKGKYSLESMLHMKTSAALDALNQNKRL